MSEAEVTHDIHLAPSDPEPTPAAPPTHLTRIQLLELEHARAQATQLGNNAQTLLLAADHTLLAAQKKARELQDQAAQVATQAREAQERVTALHAATHAELGLPADHDLVYDAADGRILSKEEIEVEKAKAKAQKQA
jgi:hypothetical protein